MQHERSVRGRGRGVSRDCDSLRCVLSWMCHVRRLSALHVSNEVSSARSSSVQEQLVAVLNVGPA